MIRPSRRISRRAQTVFSDTAVAAAAVLLAAACLFAGSAVAQAPAPAFDDPFGEVIDVRVINLEVVVEKDGERLYDLEPEDFILRVDGAEVPIEYFTEVTGGRAAESEAASDLAVPALAPGEPVETSYLVFVDNHFSIKRDRNQVLEGLIDQLPNLQQGDRMAIVEYDGRTLDMVSTWTQNPRDMERALKEAKRRDAHGLRRLAERRVFESRDAFGGGALRPSLSNGLTIDEEQYMLQVGEQVQNVALAATTALRSFADPPGRKVMLLLSGGWPSDPGQWVLSDPTRVVRAAGSLRGYDLMRDLAETANRLSYTLYPVDVPGMDTREVDIADGSVGAAELRRDRARSREFQEESALRALADETGGRAFLDGGRVDALAGVAADTRSYYWLGFTPAWRGDDRAHRVEVDVKIPGAKVRSRESYSDLSRQSEVTMMVESTLRFGGAPSGLPLEVTVERGRKKGWGKREVPVRVKIPADELTYLPIEGGLAADLELRVAVLDEAGDSADIPVIPIQMRVRQEPAEGEFALYETTLKMRKERHDLVVSLYDRLSGKIMSSRVEVPEL